jgi:hypothetical protein
LTPPTALAVRSIVVTGTAPRVGATTQFAAVATFADGTTQNVTALATWTSSGDNVAAVSVAGLVTGIGSGSVDISATYQNVTGVSHLTVVRAVFTISGVVYDGTSHGILPNVHVSTLDSVDVSNSVLTDGRGSYTITGVASGKVTITTSATSYGTTTTLTTVTSDARVDITLPRAAPDGGGPDRLAVNAMCGANKTPVTYFFDGSWTRVGDGLLFSLPSLSFQPSANDLTLQVTIGRDGNLVGTLVSNKSAIASPFSGGAQDFVFVSGSPSNDPEFYPTATPVQLPES